MLSAADEVAVNAFLNGKIKFTDIRGVIDTVLSKHQPSLGNNIDELLAADRWATACAMEIVEKQ